MLKQGRIFMSRNEIKKNRQIVEKFNFPIQQPNSFPFFMMLDT